MNTAILIDDKITIRELLNQQAARLGTSWHYLPYWFEVQEDKILAWHMNDLPDVLKKQIEEHREMLPELFLKSNEKNENNKY